MRNPHWQRFRIVYRRLSLALAFTCLGTSLAVAQAVRERPTPYFDARFGLTLYGGERRSTYDDKFRELFEAGGAGIGMEGGVVLSPRWSVGAFLLSSRYPYLLYVDGAPSFEPINPEKSSDWIHKIGAVARMHLHPERRVSPYVQGGGSIAFSLLNRHVFTGVGPRLGAGFDVKATETMRFFVEVDGIFVVPGNAMDLAGPARTSDFFSYLGFGLRYRLARAAAMPALPAHVLNVFGPEQLSAGEEGVFAADVRPAGKSTPLVFRWDFGDGTMATSPVAAHRYQAPGIYTVRFTVASGDWHNERVLTTVVSAPVVPVAVVAVQADPLVPRAGEPVSLTPVLNGTEPITCRWDLGDGTRSDSCVVSHRYVLPGTYTALLEARNTAGAVQYTRELTVRENPCADLTRLHPVYFAPNESDLDVAARGFLRQNIARLAECPSLVLEVRGYAAPGERGGARLARGRAQAVAQYYINLGIPFDRLQVDEVGTIASIPSGDAVWQYRMVQSVPKH